MQPVRACLLSVMQRRRLNVSRHLASFKARSELRQHTNEDHPDVMERLQPSNPASEVIPLSVQLHGHCARSCMFHMLRECEETG
jgi:hypothetical protein